MTDADAALNATDSLPVYPTPNPLPARGVYGFVLFLCSWFFFAVYLIWAFVPTPWLEAVHITYVPAKYWAIAIPLLFPILVTAYVTFSFAVNLIRFHGIFDNVEVVENDFGDLSSAAKVDLAKLLGPKTGDHSNELKTSETAKHTVKLENGFVTQRRRSARIAAKAREK